MKQAYLLPIAGLLWSASALAQTAPSPSVADGDMWTYENTVQVGTNWRQNRVELTVDHVSPGTIALTEKTVGAPTPPREQLVNADWSRSRNVNGHQIVVNQPLNFPLRVGKTWTVEYSEDNPNRQHSSEHFRSPYKVVGWEDVTVQAGTFHALKVEVEGDWSAAIAPSLTAGALAHVDRFGATTVTQSNRTGPSTVSGRTYKAFWYVPEVKRWVKSVEEYYSTNGDRTSSYKEELVSYKPAG